MQVGVLYSRLVHALPLYPATAGGPAVALQPPSRPRERHSGHPTAVTRPQQWSCPAALPRMHFALLAAPPCPTPPPRLAPCLPRLAPTRPALAPPLPRPYPALPRPCIPLCVAAPCGRAAPHVPPPPALYRRFAMTAHLARTYARLARSVYLAGRLAERAPDGGGDAALHGRAASAAHHHPRGAPGARANGDGAGDCLGPGAVGRPYTRY